MAELLESPPRARLPRVAWLLGLFCLGLLPRLVILASHSRQLEFWEYETLAQNIAADRGYVIWRFGHLAFAFGDGNLYSFLAGSLYRLFGHQPTLLALVQAILTSLAVPVIFAIGQRAFGTRVAALGAVLVAFHPGLLAYTLKLHPLGLDVLLLALTVLWIRSVNVTTSNRLMTGLALGVTLMSRPTTFIASVVALAVGSLRSRRPVPRVVLPVAVAVLVACPWIMRDWLVLG